MNSNLIQYIIVFIILAAVIAWIVYRLFSKKGRGTTGPCCGCALSDKCASKRTGKSNVLQSPPHAHKPDCCKPG